jgi:hypothetical protein
MDSLLAVRKETQRSDYPWKLPVRRLQRESGRPADSRDDGKYPNSWDYQCDEERATVTAIQSDGKILCGSNGKFE